MPSVPSAWAERIEGRGAHAPAPTPKPKPKAKKKPAAKKKG